MKWKGWGRNRPGYFDDLKYYSTINEKENVGTSGVPNEI